MQVSDWARIPQRCPSIPTPSGISKPQPTAQEQQQPTWKNQESKN